MNRRLTHHKLVQLRGIRMRYLLVLFVLSFSVFVFAYRQNNLDALRLREELLQIDQKNGDTETALRNLREFTYSHMNANLSGGTNNIYPPIQLKYRYDRLVQAEQDKLAAANAKLYTEAQNYCEQQVSSRVTINRIPCIQDYLSSNGVVNATIQIPDALYKFDFVSPVWSPDLAGWSLVVSIFFLLVIVSRFGAERWLIWRINR